MEIIRSTPGYAHCLKYVLLSEDEEKMEDGLLITIADGLHSKEEAIRIHEEGGHPGHFGGKVTKMSGEKEGRVYASIKVYTD